MWQASQTFVEILYTTPFSLEAGQQPPLKIGRRGVLWSGIQSTNITYAPTLVVMRCRVFSGKLPSSFKSSSDEKSCHSFAIGSFAKRRFQSQITIICFCNFQMFLWFVTRMLHLQWKGILVAVFFIFSNSYKVNSPLLRPNLECVLLKKDFHRIRCRCGIRVQDMDLDLFME